MSRLPDSSGSNSSNTDSIPSMRLARQASHDVLRTRHQLRLPAPMTVSKSTRLTPSRSRMSDSSVDDELETPSSVPRFSISSSSSTQTTLSTPRDSLPSVHEKQSGSLWIGQRVFVESMRLKGTLRFLGTTQFKSGVWAGIELDHAGSGKNDGSVDSIRYFNCPPKTGIFVLSSKVTCCRTQQQQPSHHQQQQHRNNTSNPTSPSSPQLRKKKALAKQTSLPCIKTVRQQQQQQQQQHFQHQQRPRHPLSVSPKTSGIPSPEMTPTTVHEGPNIDPPVMHQNEDKFHLVSSSKIDSDHGYSSNSSLAIAKKETDLAPTECFQCKQHEQLRADLETKLSEMTAALTSNTDITVSYKNRVKELEQSVEELKRAGMETIELYEGATQKHDVDMKRHTAKLAQAHARIQALENERDRLKLAKEDAETVLSEYTQTERPQLIEEHDQKQQKSQEEIDQLKAALEQERYTQQCAERENDRLREKVTQLENELEASQQQQQQQQLETENQQLKQKCQLLQETLKQSQTEYQHLRDRVKELPPTPVGLASIPEQQLQAQLNEARTMLDCMRQERTLESEKHRRQVNTLNRDIAELESLIEAKIFKEADLLEALDNERRVVQRLLAEHQGSIAGQRRRAVGMSTTSSARSLSSTASSSSSRSIVSSASIIPPLLPPPAAAVPPTPTTTITTTTSIQQEDETPYCEVCQVFGHDLMGCSSLLEQIPHSTTTMPSSYQFSCRQPRRTENKAF